MTPSVSTRISAAVAPLCRALGLCLLLLSQPALAAYEQDRLAGLVRDGRFAVAYAYAVEHRAEHEGEVSFDLYYGLAAIEVGELSEGIFALERVLIRSPGLDRARLELARALFLQEDDRRARLQFRIVLSHDPPAVVADRVERYLAAMDRRADRYRTTVTGWVQGGVGYDDNVNRAPDVDTVDLGFNTSLILGDEQQERDSAYASASGAVQVSRPISPGLNVIAGFDAQARRISDESEFDTRFARGRLGLRKIAGQHTFRGVVDAYRFHVGGDGYQQARGVSGSYGYAVTAKMSLLASLQVAQLEYDDFEVRDSTLTQFEFAVGRSWAGRFSPRARLGVVLGEEEADDDSVSARALATRDITGLNAWVGLTPAANWSLQAMLRVRSNEYDTNVFPFSEAREEDYYGIDLSLDWHPDAHWRVGPHLEYSENDANIELYDYERTALGVRARYSFF